MKEITIEFVRAYASSNDIPFSPTQSRLCFPIIYRMCQKMSHGIKFDEIKICDDLIIDGHHRYLSSLIMDSDLGNVQSSKTSATTPLYWTNITFDEKDWDTPAKISHLNELDAKYNGLEIEFVKQITLG